MQNLIKQGAFDNDLMGAINQNFNLAQLALGLGAPAAVGASGAISPNTSQIIVLTKASALAAMTLAAPVTGAPVYNAQGQNVGGNDGVILIITSSTSQAHTVTATGLLEDGSTTTDVATFGAHPGASLCLMAYGAKWIVLFSNQITFS